jgi:hypothetical protein
MADEEPSLPPHTDETGHVFIPHPPGSGGLECVIGCNPMWDGVRHHPDCPKLQGWRAALANVRTRE